MWMELTAQIPEDLQKDPEIGSEPRKFTLNLDQAFSILILEAMAVVMYRGGLDFVTHEAAEVEQLKRFVNSRKLA